MLERAAEWCGRQALSDGGLGDQDAVLIVCDVCSLFVCQAAVEIAVANHELVARVVRHQAAATRAGRVEERRPGSATISGRSGSDAHLAVSAHTGQARS